MSVFAQPCLPGCPGLSPKRPPLSVCSLLFVHAQKQEQERQERRFLRELLRVSAMPPHVMMIRERVRSQQQPHQGPKGK